MNTDPFKFPSTEKNLSFSWWMSWVQLFVACLIIACAYTFFINPYNIVPGGVYGIAIVIHNLIPSVQVGTISYFFDIPLLILALTLLGAKLGLRTLTAVLITPLLMNLLSWWAYPTPEALETLDPSQLFDGRLDLSQDLMLTTIIGAAMAGLGCGILIRSQATSGGSDIIGMLMQKYLKIKFSNAILIVDGTVVLFGFLVIGCGLGGQPENPSHASWELSLYSLLAVYVLARVLGQVLSGTSRDKVLFIISERRLEELHQFIIQDLDRSATSIKGSGIYTGKEKEMLFLVVDNRQAGPVKKKIQQIEPTAFVVETDAHSTFGEGFKELPKPGELTPE